MIIVNFIGFTFSYGRYYSNYHQNLIIMLKPFNKDLLNNNINNV